MADLIMLHVNGLINIFHKREKDGLHVKLFW